jgi:hypothetical protein
MAARSLIALGVVAGFLCAIIAGDAFAAGPRPVGARVRISGGSSAQRQLARLTALRVGAGKLSRVVFRPPSRLLRHEHVRGTELIVSSRGEETLRSDWEEQLYIGAYLGLMERWPKAAVAAAATEHSEGPVARLRAYDVFGSNPKSSRVARLEQRLLATASIERSHVDELRVFATPARAIAVTLSVADPAAFLKHRAQALLTVFSRPSVPLLGYYIGVEDRHGQLVWATYQLPASGGVFAIPRLDSCSPVSHSQPAAYQPPPCPAP